MLIFNYAAKAVFFP